jgi:PRTRC genetic system protein B
MNSEVLLGKGSEEMTLAKAVLLYTSRAGDMLASVNAVENGVILPGVPLDSALLSDIVAALAGRGEGSRCVLPERVLYSDASMLAWWCPESVRPIYFKSGKEDLDSFSGTPVLHPPLFFLALSQRLWVWALAGRERPTAETPLFVAPYFNMYERGNMCVGNVRLPESLRASNANLKAWESAFFETNFTHSNNSGKPLTKCAGGHNALWRNMAEAAQNGNWQFPCDAMLTPASPALTVGQVIAKGGNP